MWLSSAEPLRQPSLQTNESSGVVRTGPCVLLEPSCAELMLICEALYGLFIPLPRTTSPRTNESDSQNRMSGFIKRKSPGVGDVPFCSLACVTQCLRDLGHTPGSTCACEQGGVPGAPFQVGETLRGLGSSISAGNSPRPVNVFLGGRQAVIGREPGKGSALMPLFSTGRLRLVIEGSENCVH